MSDHSPSVIPLNAEIPHQPPSRFKGQRLRGVARGDSTEVMSRSWAKQQYRKGKDGVQSDIVLRMVQLHLGCWIPDDPKLREMRCEERCSMAHGY
jgi:hypothetical protein